MISNISGIYMIRWGGRGSLADLDHLDLECLLKILSRSTELTP